MQLEVTRCVTDWLRDATYGVNAKLGATPRDVDHSAPRSVALIVCPFDVGADANACAEWKEPGTLPALYVTPDGPVTAAGEVGTNSRDTDRVAIAIRYLERGLDAKARTDGSYVARAVVKSLRDFMRQDAGSLAARTRNEIVILTASSVTWGPWLEDVGSAKAVSVVGVEFTVRDKAP